MQAWKTKSFDRWARKERLSDDDLLQAADEISKGQFEADLGGLIIKKRVRRQGGGKSGGYRTIVAHRQTASSRLFFLHGFAKNTKADITPRETTALQTNAQVLLGLTAEQIKALESEGVIIEARRSS
jgi:hypothetical protein